MNVNRKSWKKITEKCLNVKKYYKKCIVRGCVTDMLFRVGLDVAEKQQHARAGWKEGQNMMMRTTMDYGHYDDDADLDKWTWLICYL